MKLIHKLLAACLLVGGFSVQAQNNLPEMNPVGAQAKAAQAKQALGKDALCTKCHD
jgi:hypothetical protein